MNKLGSGCPLCASSRSSLITKELYDGNEYSIVRCPDCSLVYVEDVQAPNSPYYSNLDYVDENLLWLQADHKKEAFRHALKIITKNKKVLNKIIDVGCGTGGWLTYLVKNRHVDPASCYGFDASRIQADYARDAFPNIRYALTIKEYHGYIGYDNHYDVITLWDVLEHIREPIKFMSELVQQLSKDGVFYLSIPNSLPMLLKSRLHFPNSWTPNEHVIYYSHKTIRRLCEIVGLEVIKIGSARVYKRRFSIFEMIRRVYFVLTSKFTQLSPQIYVMAKKVSEG
ncbi:MAG: class I SAM-dependent methyltransferase [Candidatus Helarchaeota archaeon]|nr:class I SAM-dependent methyltransferase [Candidatus Helarchaeota archaeon]